MPPIEFPPTDFWGVVIPTWLGAVGTIAAAVIGVIALVRGQATRGGLKEVQRGLNEPDRGAVTGATQSVLPPLVSHGEGGTAPPHSSETGNNGEITEAASAETGNPVRWTLREGARSKRFLTNSSDTEATVTGFRQIDGGDDVYTSVFLPALVGPGVEFPFGVERSFASPSVIAVEIAWTQPDVTTEFTRVFYV